MQPEVVDGVKCASFTMEEVRDELHRWERAVVVYVLGIKPPFNVMKGFIDTRWGRCGVV